MGDHAETARLVRLVEAIISADAQINLRVLQPHFDRYETLAGVTNPNCSFRLGIAVAVSKYFFSVIAETSAPTWRQQHHDQLRKLAKQEKSARKFSQKVRQLAQKSGMATHPADSPSTAAFRQWFVSKSLYDAHKVSSTGRGRPKHSGDDTFVSDMAAIYQRATGKRPTISENPAKADNPFSGAFVEFLKAVQTDARDIFRKVDRDLAQPLSASIARYAKARRLTSRPR